MKTIAVEWGPHGIRANYVSPGPIKGTEGVDRLIIAQGKSDQVLERIPLGTFGEGKDVANAIAFLASESGKYISGAELAIDGASQWVR
jgi:NAD(P)-dependent dehydrogenase (short-subunit alcohol dehydrogenase family)